MNDSAAQHLSEDKINEYRRRAYLDQRTKNTDFLFFRQNVRIPIFNVGGWHDIFAEGTVSNFVYLQNEGHEGADLARADAVSEGCQGFADAL